MAIKNGLYYTVRKDASTGYRAIVICYDHGRRMWQQTFGLPMLYREHAIERAAYEANYIADGNVPRPHVESMARGV